MQSLWQSGKSANEIARLMNLVSRSAVLGKIHRMRLAGEMKARDPKARPVKVYVRPKIKRPIVQRAAPPPPPPAPTGEHSVTLINIKKDQCHFIEGSHLAEDMASAFMCGEATGGKTYCAHHHALTHWIPPKSAKFDKMVLYYAHKAR